MKENWTHTVVTGLSKNFTHKIANARWALSMQSVRGIQMRSNSQTILGHFINCLFTHSDFGAYEMLLITFDVTL